MKNHYQVISLPARTDRREGFFRDAKAAGFPIERFRVQPGVVVKPGDIDPHDIRNMEGGGWRSPDKLAAYYPRALGCLRAHCNALSDFLYSGLPYGWIFEDDARMDPEAGEKMRRLVERAAAKYDDGWMLFFDGRYMGECATGEPDFPGAIRAVKVRCLTGMVYTRRAALTVLMLAEDGGCEIDIHHERYALNGGVVLSASPSLLRQAGGLSDIHGMSVTYPDFTKKNTLDEK